MAAASASVCRERDTIHLSTEVDVSVPRGLMRGREDGAEPRPSLTAYVVACLARVIKEHPQFNAMVARGRMITLEDITIGVLVERSIGDELVPESLPIHSADSKSVFEITTILRQAQVAADERLGGLSGATWVRLVPSAMFRTMIRLASRSVSMTRRYGVVSVTSVGMFVNGPVWLYPLSASTVALSVGGIVERPVVVEGEVRSVEHLCLTVSFDHDIIDGAPAARFTEALRKTISSGAVLKEGQVHDG
jgi:pyruvate/2-oxoglutarate dehydrogenase complex dihydrolipoamide acyltransferase (E2) component